MCYEPMPKTNVTLKIDPHLLPEVKILAAREGTSITALTAALLEERGKKDRDYERAKRRALARLRQGFNLGFQPLRSRDELYER
jgi:hypothetical protein